jgi:hypothetical protein
MCKNRYFLSSGFFNYLFIILVLSSAGSYLFIDGRTGINLFQGFMFLGTLAFMIFLILQYVKLRKREVDSFSSNNSFWFNVLPVFFCFFGLNNEPFFSYKIFWYSKLILGILFIFQIYLYKKVKFSNNFEVTIQDQ